ncbi:MAG: ATP-binding cassette domain-containing protein [Actinomycetota bacterium]|nr:ATP-binding cassette domain-containing protein [Actinomycetota bacterium]
MSSAGNALSATGVGLRGKQGRWLFRDISVELGSREIIRVSGPPGSGVSSLLQVFAGVLSPTRGTVRLRAPAVGYVPQHFPETLPLSVEEYLSWIGRIRGIRPDVRQVRITQLMRTFELGTVADQRLSSVAGNRAQVAGRLSIMQALLDEPSLLVLDNPWASTDSHLREVLSKRIIELAAAGCLIIYSGYAPALRPVKYLTLSGGRLQVTENDPTQAGVPHMRFELVGTGPGLQGQVGVIEQHKHPDGLVVTVEREHSDELIARALQSGWSIRRVEPSQ